MTFGGMAACASGVNGVVSVAGAEIGTGVRIGVIATGAATVAIVTVGIAAIAGTDMPVPAIATTTATGSRWPPSVQALSSAALLQMTAAMAVARM